jgi:hypothetical protein
MGTMLFLFGAIYWTLWLNRNDFIFNNLLISSMRAVIFRLLSFLQHWVIAVQEDRSALEQVVTTLVLL